MGRHGPAPTPTALKAHRGETRPSRLNHQEPMPMQRPPAPPRDLDRVARETGRRVMREMAPSGVILGAHRDLRTACCSTVAVYRQAMALWHAAGDTPLVRGPAARASW
jgi:phage terminase small subunit